MEETSKKETRTRNWSIIIYDDSAPENWREILDDLHIEWVESPLHDKDINADGAVKKAHRHILLLFGGVKTYNQVKEIVEPLNCPIPQRCHNSKAMVRYMAHLDNPEKAKYNINEIIGHGGVDVAELLRPSSSERYTILDEMMQFIKDNGIIEFQDIIDYARIFRRDDWFPLLCDNSTIVISNYVKSCRHRTKRLVDFSTGEVLGATTTPQ